MNIFTFTLLLASFGIVLSVGYLLWRYHIAPDRFGAANTITLSRNLFVVAIINILVFDYGSNEGLIIAGLSITTLLLDGLDGYVARKMGICSGFGARFDMESDAFFILVLSIGAIVIFEASLWVVLIGTMRYLYVAGQYVYAPLNLPVSDRYSRKVFCVIQIVALVLPYTGILPKSVWEPLLFVALALLTFSFGRDVIEQVKTSNKGECNEAI